MDFTEAEDPINPFEWNDEAHSIGLTKREYFAIQIMQSVMSTDPSINQAFDHVPYNSVKLADALIDELNKDE